MNLDLKVFVSWRSLPIESTAIFSESPEDWEVELITEEAIRDALYSAPKDGNHFAYVIHG